MIKKIVTCATILLAFVVTSCSKNEFIGSWSANSESYLAEGFSYRPSIEFKKDGSVLLTALINAEATAATASVQGTWKTLEDNDDLILSFDMNSISIGGTNDSTKAIQNAFKAELSKYNMLEDVEVERNVLTFETNDDQKYAFNKVNNK